MSEHVLQTIEDLKREISKIEIDLSEKKRMANFLSKSMAGGDEIYPVESADNSNVLLPTKGDEYYGKSATSAVRLILEARKSTLGPATVAELYETLVKGGYQFETDSPVNAKNSLRVSLSKNSGIFHKLPNGKYGLVKWYDRIKPKKQVQATDDDSDGIETMEKEFGEVSLS